MATESQMIVRSSSSASRRLGIQCAESCDCLSDRVAGVGRRWLELFRCSLAKMESLGGQGSPGKTSLAFEKKSETDGRLREFSRSAKFSDTNRTCLLGPTTRTIK